MKEPKTKSPQSEDKPKAAEPPPKPAPANTPEARIRAILNRARAGDRTVLPQLERLLAANPGYWDNAGDLIRLAEQAWIEKIGEKDLVFGQSLRKHVERWKRELADPSGSPLERLLAARIVITWLASQHSELAEASSQGEGPRVAELRIRRAESANRRFLASIKTLATVRRLVSGLKIEIRHSGSAPQENGSSEESHAPAPSRVPPGTSPSPGHVSDDAAVRDRVNQLFKQHLMPEEVAAAGIS